MQKAKKERNFIKKAYFKGGSRAMNDFIHKNLRYPTDAFEKGIEGTVRLRLDIDYKGNVTAVKTISGPEFGCQEEAERVAKLMKFVVPKNPPNIKVLYHHHLNIHFKLPKSKTQNLSESPQSIHLVYQYNPNTTSAKSHESKSEPSSKISYTIKLG